MQREIIVTIDVDESDEKFCGDCIGITQNRTYCNIFNEELYTMFGNVYCKRCNKCLKAERNRMEELCQHSQ